MSRINRSGPGVFSRLVVTAALIGMAGCGMDRLAPTLPDAIAGFSLADLKSIQDDERLTDDEKKAQIRAAVDAPDDADGDRLVNFLFSLNVP